MADLPLPSAASPPSELGQPGPAIQGLAVLVPVKAFGEAKLRLSPALDPAGRARVARSMATMVLRAAGPLPTAVVCDDIEVANWARDCGALVIWQPEQGLNRAVEAGVSRLAALGATKVVVAHGDLPQARNLGQVGDHDGVTLVPDRDENGTPVIGVPSGAGFRFSYGPGSFARHRSEAERLGLDVRIMREPTLQADVDVPADLAATPLGPPVTDRTHRGPQ